MDMEVDAAPVASATAPPPEMDLPESEPRVTKSIAGDLMQHVKALELVRNVGLNDPPHDLPIKNGIALLLTCRFCYACVSPCMHASCIILISLVCRREPRR